MFLAKVQTWLVSPPTPHDRQEAQAVETVLALLAGAAVFGFMVLTGWGLPLVDLSVSRSDVLIPIAGAGGITTTLARLIRLRHAGL
jgi:hypothetical protein